MKKFLLAGMLLLFVLNTFSQTGINKEYSKDYYLQKSKNKKTVAWILLGGGTALLVGGAKISFDKYGVFGKTNFWDYASLTGLVADIVSIPFFSSAHTYKKMAASVAITNQKILWNQKKCCWFCNATKCYNKN